MFLVFIVLAIVIGWLLGGSVRGIANVRVKGLFLIPIPFLLRFLIQQQIVNVKEVAIGIQVVSYLLLAIWALINSRLPGGVFFVLGTIANAIVIIANDGLMPVSGWAVAVAAGDTMQNEALVKLWASDSLTHTVLSPRTRFPWLADIIPLPRPFPAPSVISIGDILLVFGLFWLVLRGMLEYNMGQNGGARIGNRDAGPGGRTCGGHATQGQ